MNIFGEQTKDATNGADIATSMIFLQNENKVYMFDNNTLAINFPLYKKIGSMFDYKGIFTGLKQKVMFEFHILYRWVDVEYAPRFNFKIMINDIEYINRNLGVSDELDVNLFLSNIIIDLKPYDRIEVLFLTDYENNLMIEIIDNSYYILRSF